MYLKNFLLREKTGEAGDTGTGGVAVEEEGDLNIDIDKVSDAIGADLGLNDGEGTDADLGSATPPKDGDKPPVVAKPAAPVAPLKEGEKVLPDPKDPAAIEAAAKAKAEAELAAKPAASTAPKAWKKEMHEAFTKLPADVQGYIAQREAQVEEGFKANASAVRYAESIFQTVAPYQAMLDAQGIKDHAGAMKFLLNAHYILSTAPAGKKEAYFADLAKSYSMNMEQVVEFFKNGAPAQTDTEKALLGRLDALENGRNQENQQKLAALKQQSMSEVEAFASDPAHSYFAEVAGEVSLLLRADVNLTLAEAYERAVYANPVTRAKEFARLQKEAGDKLRAEAEEKAKAADKARGTVVKGAEEHRESPDPLGSMDTTLRETMKTIKNRVST